MAEPRALGLLVVRLRIITCILLGNVGVLAAAGECQFPERWHGSWFQSGISQSIKIHGGFMTFKGRCIASDGDKYLLEDKTERCVRCIVIHQRHENILQYKETFCDSNNMESINNICSHINGDAPLHSMFRVDALPVSCPFRGAFTFSYNRGQSDCRSPPSTIESCSEDHRILFKYQACPDIPGTESSVEELTCLAAWREGSVRYLVGKLEHNMANTDEDKYRCFVYDRFKDGTGYHVAQSGDATCNGLISATEGSKTMRLLKVSFPSSTCQFPSWLTVGHHWHSLNGHDTLSFSHRNHSFRMVDHAGSVSEMHVICTEEFPSGDKRHRVFATHINVGCSSAYKCFSFIKRGDHVVEVQTGQETNSREPCDHRYFDPLNAPFTTLVTSLPERRRCPYAGQYTVPGALVVAKNRDECDSFVTVKIGCDNVDTIELRYECTNQLHVLAYHCHSNWEENGTSYLITTLKGTKNKYCFMYSENENTVKFSGVRDSCKRNIQLGIEGHMAFNFTTSPEQCSLREIERTAMASGSSAASKSHIWGFVVVILITACILMR